MQPEMLSRSSPMSSSLRGSLKWRDRRCATRVERRAGDDVAEEAEVGGRELGRLQALPQRKEVALAYVREHDVLVVRDAYFVERELVGEVGHQVHLVGGGIARR